MNDIAASQLYLERYFVGHAELARLAAVSEAEVAALIVARAIPGPIYSIWQNGAFWSAIGGHHGEPPQGEPAHWYTPASVWWIRRAQGLIPAQAAEHFGRKFRDEFVAILSCEQQGILGYPEAYPDGRFSPEAASLAAEREWADWLDGGYGVCLRHADARHAIVKTCRRAAILSITDHGRAATLSQAQRALLLDSLEELDSVMLPFAPHQRPSGTPGLWLDTILARYGLGTTREHKGVAASHLPRLCA